MVLKSSGVVLVVLLAAGVVATPVVAADQSIGYVDVQRVFADYNRTKDSNAELEAYGKDLNTKLQAILQHKLLDDNERKQLLELIAKPSPTDKDKEQLKALDDRQKALDQELQALQAKNPLSEQEKARQKELMDRSAKTDEELAKLNEEYDKLFNDKQEELSKVIRDDILKAIQAIAENKKLALVIDKIAVLYGGTDITQPVIDRLNKK